MRRSRHSLSHYRLFTCNMAELVPIGCVEVLPGDTFRHQTSLLMRVSPMVAPVMHPVHLRVHHWYIPHRLVWDDFDDMITGANPTVTVPQVTVPALASRSFLLDHLGVDPNAVGITVNALPVRGYNLVWNEYYRDQDLQTELPLDQLVLQKADWEKDYFTTARPSPQQGAEVSIPFSTGQVPVSGIGLLSAASAPGSNATVYERSGGSKSYPSYYGGGSPSLAVKAAGATSPYRPDVYADLSQATGGIAVSELREAFALQRFAEARSRFGDRYVDYLRYLGVRPSDGRLDRPEYLGGGRQTIAFSEVLSTASTAEGGLGDMGGHGIAAMRTRPYRRFFEEHGYVLSLAVVRPKAIYAQQLNRTWLRQTKDDFWQKEMEILGQQPVSRRELYAAHPNVTDLFGYVDRHLDYRQHPSFVSGTFRDSTDNHWHMSRVFSSSPQLNASFVSCDPTNRIFADTNMPQLYTMAQHRIAARRLVSRRARMA